MNNLNIFFVCICMFMFLFYLAVAWIGKKWFIEISDTKTIIINYIDLATFFLGLALSFWIMRKQSFQHGLVFAAGMIMVFATYTIGQKIKNNRGKAGKRNKTTVFRARLIPFILISVVVSSIILVPELLNVPPFAWTKNFELLTLLSAAITSAMLFSISWITKYWEIIFSKR